MPEHFRWLMDLGRPEYIPFVGLATGHQSPMVIRLAEAAIIAGVVTAGNVMVLGERISHLQVQVQELKVDLASMRGDLYAPRGVEPPPGYRRGDQ